MRVAGCGRSSSRSRRRRRTSYPIASPFANHSDESGTVCSQKHTLAFCLVFNFLLLSILTFSRRSITHSQFTQFRLFLYGTIGLRCRRFYAILEQCRRVHGVDLGESFQTHIFLQTLASIQPRTNPPEMLSDRGTTSSGSSKTFSALSNLPRLKLTNTTSCRKIQS